MDTLPALQNTVTPQKMHTPFSPKRLLPVLLVAFVVQSAAVAELPESTGHKAATFEEDAVRLAADPVRPRIYALTKSNELLVFDTSTLKLIKRLPVGSSPRRMAISPDTSRLFVVNTGSTTDGLTIIDLQNLTVLGSRATPYKCFGVSAASSTRVFLTPVDRSDDSLLEMDLSEGTSTPFNPEINAISDSAHIALSPDGKTLVVGNNGYSPSSLFRFDATTSPPTSLQYVFDPGGNGLDLFFSHDAKSFVFPCGGGNSDRYDIAFFDPNDIEGRFGSLETGAYPSNGAFSVDDRFFFSAPDPEEGIQVWNTQTFAMVGSFPLEGILEVDQMICNSSGKYLFAVEATDVYSDSPRKIGVYLTGLAPRPFESLAGSHILVPPDVTTEGFPIAEVKVSVTGAFSGKLRDRGRTYSFKGILAPGSSTDLILSRSGGLPSIVLRIGSTAGAEGKELFGILNPQSDHVDLSVLHRQVFTKSAPAPQTGRYTAHLPVGELETLGLGVGYSSFAISKTGAIKGAGALGDGTRFTFAAAICIGDYVVLNVPLYQKGGALAGMLRFRDVASVSDLDGMVSWFRPASSSQFNSAGFSITRSWQAARYAPPAKGANILPFTSAELSLAAEHLTPIEPVTVTFGTNNSVTPSTNSIGLKAMLSSKSGVFSGQFTQSGQRRPTKWKGVVQTKRARAEGLFKTVTEFGTATLK